MTSLVKQHQPDVATCHLRLNRVSLRESLPFDQRAFGGWAVQAVRVAFGVFFPFSVPFSSEGHQTQVVPVSAVACGKGSTTVATFTQAQAVFKSWRKKM